MNVLEQRNFNTNVLEIIFKCLNPIETRYNNCSDLLDDIEKL